MAQANRSLQVKNPTRSGRWFYNGSLGSLPVTCVFTTPLRADVLTQTQTNF